MIFVICLLAATVLYSKYKDKIKVGETVKITAFAAAVRIIAVTLICLMAEKASAEFFSAWDGDHYIDIAKNGYVNEGAGVEFIVFYPLYPLLIRVFSVFAGGYFSAGMAVSNISAVAAGVYFYKLCRLDLNEEDSFFALLLINIFPFSFFMSGVYTEGLFLLLSVAAFYYMRKNKFPAAGMLAFLAALTRVQGVLLFIPMLYEALKENKKKIVYAVFPILGFAVYLFINYAVFGDFFKFMEYQKEIWYQRPSWIFDNLANYVSYIIGKSELSFQIMLPQLVLFVSGCACIYTALKKGMRLSYALYSIAYIFTVYSASWLLSGGRYFACLFPLYIGTSYAVKNKTARELIIILNVLLSAVMAVMYAHFKQIM